MSNRLLDAVTVVVAVALSVGAMLLVRRRAPHGGLVSNGFDAPVPCEDLRNALG